jgi:hypothetical protein
LGAGGKRKSWNSYGDKMTNTHENLNGLGPAMLATFDIKSSACFREAAYAVETAWFAAIKGSALDRPEPKRNAYELAKAGECNAEGAGLFSKR